jgi:hypothetical protein
MGKTLIYLAVPYSHADDSVCAHRFEAVNKVAAKLMKEGKHIFSPISHTRPIALAGELPHGWDYWQSYDRCILECCGKMIVLKLEGWETSKGVTGEIAIANELEIQVEYMDYE